jgi:4-hydroxybenzoate polyprenyltransferase
MPRRAFDLLLALAQASHPFPIAAVLSLTTLVGLASAGTDLAVGRLAVVLLAMLLSQLAIGWTNDYVDRDSDALHQASKPIAMGRLEARMLPPLSALAVVTSTTLAAWLGPWPLAFFLAGTTAGLAYDLRLKDTRLSWTPYVVALAVLPPFVWSAFDTYRSDFVWLYPVALPLVIAVHLANLLPDLATDRAAGRQNVAVRLGRTVTLSLLALCLIAPAALAATSTLWLDYNEGLFAATMDLYCLLLLVAALQYERTAGADGSRVAFRCVAGDCVVFIGGLLAAL